jgi:hypothetical protein
MNREYCILFSLQQTAFNLNVIPFGHNEILNCVIFFKENKNKIGRSIRFVFIRNAPHMKFVRRCSFNCWNSLFRFSINRRSIDWRSKGYISLYYYYITWTFIYSRIYLFIDFICYTKDVFEFCSATFSSNVNEYEEIKFRQTNLDKFALKLMKSFEKK